MDEASFFGEVYEKPERASKRRLPKQCKACTNCANGQCRFDFIRSDSPEYRTTYPYGNCPERKT